MPFGIDKEDPSDVEYFFDVTYFFVVRRAQRGASSDVKLTGVSKQAGRHTSGS